MEKPTKISISAWSGLRGRFPRPTAGHGRPQFITDECDKNAFPSRLSFVDWPGWVRDSNSAVITNRFAPGYPCPSRRASLGRQRAPPHGVGAGPCLAGFLADPN